MLSLRMAFWVGLAAALSLPPLSVAQSTLTESDGTNEECPLVPGCCEEDCCADDTFWEPTAGRCFHFPGYPGFIGQYSEDYEWGCVPRKCCEADCCADGTVYDSSVKCCVESDTPDTPSLSPAPTPSPTVTPSSSCTGERCFRMWEKKEVKKEIDFASDDMISGLEKVMDNAVGVMKKAIDDLEDFVTDLVDVPLPSGKELAKILQVTEAMVKRGIYEKAPDWVGDLARYLRRQVPRGVLPQVVKLGVKELGERLSSALEDPFEGRASQCNELLFGPSITSNAEEFGVTFTFDADIEEIGFTVEGKLRGKIDLGDSPRPLFVDSGQPQLSGVPCDDKGPKEIIETIVATVEAKIKVKFLVLTAALDSKGNDNVGNVIIPLEPSKDGRKSL